MWASVIVLIVDAGKIRILLSGNSGGANHITVVVSMVIWATITLYRDRETNPLLMKMYRDSISYFLLNCCEFLNP